MAFQTTYNLNPAVAVPGELADTGFTDKLSRLLTVAASAGLAVVFKAGDKDSQVRPPDATGQVTGPNLSGVVIYDPAAVNAPNAIGDSVSVLKRGRIWVSVEEAVTPASPVFIRFAAGTFPTLGAFRASADTSTAVAVPNGAMKFITTQATIGGLVLVEVNLP